MNRAQFLAILVASVAAATTAPAYAAPVDGALAVSGFEAMAAHDVGIIVDPMGDMSVDAASIARVWTGESNGTSPANFSQPPHGVADFQTLLRDSDGRSITNGGLDRNPYFALGTWGGDGRAIVHNIIAADRGMHGSGGGEYAVELSFAGFNVGDDEHDTATDGPAPFDGEPMFIPNPFGFPGVNPSSGGGNGGTMLADNSFSNPGSSDPGTGGGTGGNNPDDPSTGASGGSGSAPTPVPEPSGLALLFFVIPAVILINRRRTLARVAMPVAIAATALLFVPGSANAQLRDWEQLCNGIGGVPPAVAIEGCSQVINNDSESLNDVAIAYNNRGNALRALNRFDEAKADYDNAIILAPSDPFPYRNRGVTYGLLGDYAAALADFDRAIVLAPKYASAYLGRAFALEQLGNRQAAAADFAQAAKLDPKLVAALHAPQAATQTAALPDATTR
ncbi:MAG TPA: tetratricopeptide repeat protein [Stellaceae bacterium]|nr:tetratricopeptide repeat protein [Stellaceae bacterium]